MPIAKLKASQSNTTLFLILYFAHGFWQPMGPQLVKKPGAIYNVLYCTFHKPAKPPCINKYPSELLPGHLAPNQKMRELKHMQN